MWSFPAPVVFSTFRHGLEARSYLGHAAAMSEEHVVDGAAAEQRGVSAASAKAEPKASPKRKASRPKIDLDDEIRRANDLAAMSRKMLAAAKVSAKNNKRSKQRLIKKAGKLTPEDLERIAVLKRCGLFVEEGDDDEGNPSGHNGATGSNKEIIPGPSQQEQKRPQLSKKLKLLTENNPILEEVGFGAFAPESSGSASSASGSRNNPLESKKSTLVVSKRARLPRGPSFDSGAQASQPDPEAAA